MNTLLHTIIIGRSYLLVFFLCLGTATWGQAQDMSSPLPKDTLLRMGKLPNGLSYYVRRNTNPENRVEFRFMLRAGSVDEDNDQLGMAHMIEHMLFNGTESFEKNEVIEFLQSIGVSFGGDLNAYTSFDETVYFIHAPADNMETLDKCFLLIKEWMSAATLDKKEIDSERKIVLEELRLWTGASSRLIEEILPLLAAGSKYKDRLPIGTEESIQKNSHEAIRRYYTDWYRPDLIGFAIVGDLDADLMEEKIKTYFGSIPPSKNPINKEKQKAPQWPQEGTTFVFEDKESPQDVYMGIYRTDQQPTFKTKGDMQQELSFDLATYMFDDRIREIAEQENSPLSEGGASIGSSFIRSIFGITYQVALFEGSAAHRSGVEAMQQEIQRALLHGFTEGELEKQKKNLLNSFKNRADNQKKARSEQYAQQYVSHYLDSEHNSLMDDRQKYALAKELLPSIHLEMINTSYRQLHEGAKEFHFIMRGKGETGNKGDTTTSETLKEAIKAGKSTVPKPYVFESTSSTSLLPQVPQKGSILSKKEIPSIGATEVMLSNGVKVILKPTDFEENQIIFSASAVGGKSIFEEGETMSFHFLDDITNASGLGEFSRKDLANFLSGKTIQLNFEVDDYTHGLSGSTTPSDLETAMQLIHLSFTSLRKDEKSFNAWMKKQKNQAKAILAHPMVSFYMQVNQISHQDHPRSPIIVPTEEQLSAVRLDQVMQSHQKAYGNAANFTFYIVGNFEVKAILALLEQYIASLPSQQSEEKIQMVDHNVRVIEGPIERTFPGGQEGSSNIFILHTSYAGAYDAKKQLSSQILSEILRQKLTKKLREKEGGTYSLQVAVGSEMRPVHSYHSQFMIPCDPQRVSKMIKLTKKVASKLQKGKITTEDLQKSKEIAIKDHEENLKKNSPWIRFIQQSDQYALDYDRINTKIDRIKALTATDIQEAAQRGMDLDKLLVFISNPTGKE